MNILKKNGIFAERRYGENFAYILDDTSFIIQTEYKVLHSLTDETLLRCSKLLYNGKPQLYYLVDNYKSLESVLTSIDSDRFMKIMTNLLGSIMAIKNNGFLICANLDMSFSKIYVDLNTFKVKLTYLPVSQHLHQDEYSFENELRAMLVHLIDTRPNLQSQATSVFSGNLLNGTIDLESLYNLTRDGAGQVDTKTSASGHGQSGYIQGGYSQGGYNQGAFGQGNQNAFHQAGYNSTPGGSLKLISMDAARPLTLSVSKDHFVIGKKTDAVDGVVGGNPMISRVHCEITKMNNRFQVTDLNSANGTFVNGEKIQAQLPRLIENGDILKLANSSFRVVYE